MISKKEVEHIAKLARLKLTEKEAEKMQKDLSAILDYFNLLKKAPKKSNLSLGEATKFENANLREDKAAPQRREVVERIIAAAPDKKDDYIKVKTVL